MPIKRIRIFLKRNERYLMPAALLAGFVFDSITLTRIDQLYDNIVLFSYLIIVGAGITVSQLHKYEVWTGVVVRKIVPWLPLFIQFAFGGLFSGYFIFYSRSASLAASWLFIAVLLFLLVGNEFFRKRYTRLSFLVSIYYLAIFSFAIFFVPVVIGKLGAWVFLLSGIISLAAIWMFLYFLFRVIPEEVVKSARVLTASIFGIYLSVNVLYFQNIIPPIPLSLKDIGAYHSVEKTMIGDYVGASEERVWWNVYEWIRKTIHIEDGDPVYVYSAVFAPTTIRTDMVYVWQYYDGVADAWITASEIPVRIVGGRDGGYRSFSFKWNILPGLWRVNVVTPRGQLIGRTKFVVEVASEVPPLHSVAL